MPKVFERHRYRFHMRLKIELLEHFEKSAEQRESDGNKVVLVFPNGMHEMLQNAKLISDYKSEALQSLTLSPAGLQSSFSSF